MEVRRLEFGPVCSALQKVILTSPVGTLYCRAVNNFYSQESGPYSLRSCPPKLKFYLICSNRLHVMPSQDVSLDVWRGQSDTNTLLMPVTHTFLKGQSFPQFLQRILIVCISYLRPEYFMVTRSDAVLSGNHKRIMFDAYISRADD